MCSNEENDYQYSLAPLLWSHKPNQRVLEPPGVHRPHFDTHCCMLFIFILFFLCWQPASCHYPLQSMLPRGGSPLLAAPSRSMGWGNSSCLTQASMLLDFGFKHQRNGFESQLYHCISPGDPLNSVLWWSGGRTVRSECSHSFTLLMLSLLVSLGTVGWVSLTLGFWDFHNGLLSMESCSLVFEGRWIWE